MTGKTRLLGYTLVEIATTMIIVAILTIAVYPRFFSILTYNQRVYYDEVLNSLRYARKLAMATGNHIQASLTPTSLLLQRRIEGSTCTSGTTFQPIIDPQFRTQNYLKVAPNNITLNFSAGWPIYFDGLGRALHAKDCSVIDFETINVVGGKMIKVFGETGYIE